MPQGLLGFLSSRKQRVKSAPETVKPLLTPSHICCVSLLQGANANYAGVSGLMGPPGSAGAVTPVVQQKLQKMVQTNRCGCRHRAGNLLEIPISALISAFPDACVQPCLVAGCVCRMSLATGSTSSVRG